MLIRINNQIINTANVVSAYSTPAAGQRKEGLQIVFVNHLQATNSTGIIPREGEEAAQVWDVLCQEARDATRSKDAEKNSSRASFSDNAL